MTRSTVLVALDPSSAKGESALSLVERTDHVTLFLPLSGSASRALSEYAAAENISIPTAGEVYLDQVATRLRSDGYAVDAVSSSAVNAVDEILHLVGTERVTKVALPAGSIALDRRSLGRLVSSCPVPVVIAPAA
ncbi:MAG: hypothetical protein AB7Q42_21200 [Acidimicrobiia bacterium]